MTRMTAMLCAVGMLTGKIASAQEPTRGWLDVSLGVAIMAEPERTSTRILFVSQELAGGSVAYDFHRGASFDLGGGYMFTDRVGIGATLGGTAHRDTAGLAISVPHPTLFNRSATDATVTAGKLDRIEGAIHLSGMFVIASGRHYSVRAFGGPSYFRVQQDVIGVINYRQQYTLSGINIVAISTYETDKSEATGWGGHVGVDGAYFFNHVVGVGGFGRYSRGTVELADYGQMEDVKAGGFQFGGGLRLRF